jgi:hypothetical protein
MKNSRLNDPNSKQHAEKGKPEPKDWNETYDDIDIDLCIPHPSVAGMRFEYECEALERSISEIGQLEPCRVVRSEEDGMHLLVYIGQRRLQAVRILKSKYGTPSTLKVIIDEDDILEEELVKRALAENVDENGQRMPLSDLEKVAYCRNLLGKYNEQRTEKILTNAGLERNTARKIIFLVEKLDNQKVERLHKIESRSNFRFKIAHLDLLLACEDEENLYETASLAAFSQKPPEEIKTLRQAARHFSKDIPWFEEIFPQFPLENPNSDEEGGSKGKESHDGYDSEETPRPDKSDNQNYESDFLREPETPLGALPEPVILILCHHCKSLNPFKLRTGSPEFIFCNLKEEGLIEQLAIGGNEVFDCERECSACGKSFWITASMLDGGKIAVETSTSRTLEVPKREASVRKVCWEQNGGGWMLYDDVSKKKFSVDSAAVDSVRMESGDKLREE